MKRWTPVTVGDLCDLQNGFAFKSKDYIDHSNTLSIRMSNIRPNGVFDPHHNIRFLPDEFTLKYEEYRLGEGDLIIAMTDMAGDPKILGVPTLVSGLNGRNFLLNQRVGRLCSFSEKVHVPYLRYYLSLPITKRYYKSKGAGGVQINISKKDILSAKIPLPPLSEQKRIADILDKADAMRRKQKVAVELADSLTQSIFLEMFGNPATNSMGWDVESGRNIFSDLTYGSSSKAFEMQTSGSLRILRIPNIIGGEVNWSDLKFVELTTRERDRLILKRDDLLFVRTNGNPEYIGRCARFDGAREAIFASYLIRGRVDESIALKPEFLKQIIEHPTYRQEVRREARTTAGNFNLSTAGIRKFQFIKPPLGLQNHFLKIVESNETLKTRQLVQLAKLDTLFNSLVQRAFKGEL